jgi:hypothetical protein
MAKAKMEAHARTLIETAIALTSREFVTSLVGEESSPAAPASTQKKRGRKPGAAPAADRCAWVNGDKQCKNKHTDSKYCTRHANMVAALPNDHAASD